MPNTAIILPTVDLSKTLVFGPVTLLPKSEALAAVDDDQRPRAGRSTASSRGGTIA
jgi:hypothetical protein